MIHCPVGDVGLPVVFPDPSVAMVKVGETSPAVILSVKVTLELIGQPVPPLATVALFRPSTGNTVATVVGEPDVEMVGTPV